MPIVECHLIEGYPPEARERLTAALTQAVRLVIPAAPEAITVLLHEIPAANYARGGTRRAPAPALPDVTALVRAFLTAMEARDLPAAQGYLGAGFHMIFPGDIRMTRLEELVAWSKTRYRAVAKTYERFEAVPGETGAAVYCFGTLSGTWLDGTAFDGIRFIDRFELADGLIVRQDVWNDMGEVRHG